jgi:hypothetical protein
LIHINGFRLPHFHSHASPNGNSISMDANEPPGQTKHLLIKLCNWILAVHGCFKTPSF